ncbi:extensin family protein [Dinoroseobacter sp. S375]|uniref:extensin-like domain-containing protein n=1 Tax=Dinoroseobacter sp. S375 TaxID=3415136 RepID=UPI003C7D4DAC
MSLGRGAVLAAVLAALSLPALALDRSPRPAPRTEELILSQVAERFVPVPRPALPLVDTSRAIQAASLPSLRVSPRPTPRGTLKPRPARVQVTRPQGTPSKVGRICGSRQILGRSVPDIAGRLRGCGVRNAVQVVEVEGVRLSTASTMTCEAAEALRRWVDTGVKPAVKRTGGGVAELRVAAHYSCRTRNHKVGAKISEHGKGKAIDISAIMLKDGTAITVLKGWDDRKQGRMLRQMHQAACGPFGTVLGPEADRYHKDHFHFDVARYRSGLYCR